MIRCEHRLDGTLRENFSLAQSRNPVADRIEAVKVMGSPDRNKIIINP